jgi:uncharacterized protein
MLFSIRPLPSIALRFPVALVLLIVCLVVPAWADFQAGMDANTREDYATALREWRPLAEKGDALAQYHLGVLYRKGRGVPQDDVQARGWYAKAAAQGQAKAQFNLGTLYFNGEGVPKDYQQALRWFRLAADQGEALAQTKMAVMYDEGQGGRRISSRRISGTVWRQQTGINQRPYFVIRSPTR